MQFGRVVDATLMIDKDTGRPRGFGFVTFDSEAAVEATLAGPLEILGKPIEVKKAQPRGNMRDEEDRRNRRGREGFRDGTQADSSQQQQTPQSQTGLTGGLTPQMMAQYWQRMQQYFALMQQQMAVAAAAQGQAMGGMGMGAMNPAMMQQMQQMKQMQQMQMGGGQQQGGINPQSPGPSGMPNMQNMMNPAMMQQMQQMQSQGQGANVSGMGGNMPGGMGMGGNAMAAGGGMSMGGNFTGARGGPGYNAQEQLAFEQQKYEQQQARRAIENRGFSPYQQGGPTSWEGMYDEVPQPSIPTGPQGMNRGGSMGRGMPPNQNVGGSRSSAQSSKGPTPQPQSAAPANAPTGPKNAGKPGANYRGGGRGGHRGFHPYARG